MQTRTEHAQQKQFREPGPGFNPRLDSPHPEPYNETQGRDD